MLKLDLRLGEELHVGDAIIRVVKKYGQAVSLVIDAPKSIDITKKNAGDTENQRKTHCSSS